MSKTTKIEGWFSWGSIGEAGAFRTNAPFSGDCMKATLVLHIPDRIRPKRKKMPTNIDGDSGWYIDENGKRVVWEYYK